MMSVPTLVTFIIYLIGMLAIGVIAYRMTDNLSDYVLVSRMGSEPGEEIQAEFGRMERELR